MDLVEETRTCGMEDVRVKVLTPFAVDRLRMARRAGNLQVAKSYVIDALGDAPVVEFAVCPFDGPVEIRYHRGAWDWTCPLCSSEHGGQENAD